MSSSPVGASTKSPVYAKITKISCSSVVKKRKKRRKLTPTQLSKLHENGSLWHRIMGHISAPYVNKLLQVALGVDDLIRISSIKNCTVCGRTKMTRKSFTKDRDRATRVGEIVHADLIGPITPLTYHTKKQYIVCILDEYSRYLMIFIIKNKTETAKCIDLAYRELQAKYPNKGQFHIFRCDQGSEFTSSACEEILDKYAVKIQTSETNCHEHSGVPERVNNTTIQQRIRSLLEESGFPSYLWGQIADTACWLYNIGLLVQVLIISLRMKCSHLKPQI